MTDNVKTTTANFQQFSATVRRLWGMLGIQSWDLLVLHGNQNSGIKDQGAASCGFDPPQRRIMIVLSEEVGADDIPRLDEMALHEVCHAFLGPLENAARDRYVSEGDVEAASHEVVHRLALLLRRLDKGSTND